MEGDQVEAPLGGWRAFVEELGRAEVDAAGGQLPTLRARLAFRYDQENDRQITTALAVLIAASCADARIVGAIRAKLREASRGGDPLALVAPEPVVEQLLGAATALHDLPPDQRPPIFPRQHVLGTVPQPPPSDAPPPVWVWKPRGSCPGTCRVR